MVTYILYDQQQEVLCQMSKKDKKVAEKTAQSQSFLPGKVTERKEIADSGHPKAYAQEAQQVHSCTMTPKQRQGKRM